MVLYPAICSLTEDHLIPNFKEAVSANFMHSISPSGRQCPVTPRTLYSQNTSKKHADSESLELAGFCEQMDLHDGTATIREALEFSAILRQDRSISRADKIAYVDKIINLLELGDMQESVSPSFSKYNSLFCIECPRPPGILHLQCSKSIWNNLHLKEVC